MYDPLSVDPAFHIRLCSYACLKLMFVELLVHLRTERVDHLMGHTIQGWINVVCVTERERRQVNMNGAR